MAEVSFEVVSIIAMTVCDAVEIVATGDGDDCLTILTSNKEYAKAQYIGAEIKFAAWMSAEEQDADPIYCPLQNVVNALEKALVSEKERADDLRRYNAQLSDELMDMTTARDSYKLFFKGQKKQIADLLAENARLPFLRPHDGP